MSQKKYERFLYIPMYVFIIYLKINMLRTPPTIGSDKMRMFQVTQYVKYFLLPHVLTLTHQMMYIIFIKLSKIMFEPHALTV